MSRGAPGPAGAIVGVGVDAVDVARFRRVLDRRPRFATRCFTASERADATGSADEAQTLAARKQALAEFETSKTTFELFAPVAGFIQ